MAFLLALLMGLGHAAQASASAVQNAKDKINEAENELNSVQMDMNRIENQQNELQVEINALDAELVEVIVSLGILETDLANKEAELVQREQELVQAQADEEQQYQAMKKRIRFMYERGDTAFLTAILEAKSITEMLNRVEYYNEVYSYDRELLVNYQNVRQQVTDLKQQVEFEIAEMQELQENYQEEQARYETLIAQKQTEMDDFDEQLANARVLAQKYQDTINEQNEIIRKEQERLEQERRRQEELRRQEEERRQKEEEANRNNAGGSGSSEGSGGESSGGSGGGKNPPYVTGVSGSAVVDYACQYIGNPYVYGGEDIENGIDCSAFVRYVFKNYGINLPRTSYEQRSVGQEVSFSNAQPGDIICYSGHVAIYMGNNQIVHASNSAPYPAGGIKTGQADYRTILTVRRVL